MNEPPLKPKRAWYGWQTLLCDLVGTTLLVIAVADDSTGLGVASLSVLVIGAPLVHGIHSNAMIGLASMFARGAVLALMWRGGVHIAGSIFPADRSTSDAAFPSVFVGAYGVLFGLGAITMDAGFLAFETHRSVPHHLTHVSPSIDPASGSYGLRFQLVL